VHKLVLLIFQTFYDQDMKLSKFDNQSPVLILCFAFSPRKIVSSQISNTRHNVQRLNRSINCWTVFCSCQRVPSVAWNRNWWHIAQSYLLCVCVHCNRNVPH